MKIFTQHFFLVIFIIVSCAACNHGNNSDKENSVSKEYLQSFRYKETPRRVQNIADRIAGINELQDEHVGYGGTESENYKNFEELIKVSTTEDLVKLTYNANAVVACYAGWALADNSYPDLKNIFSRFLSEQKSVRTFSGCIVSSGAIAGELYYRYKNRIDYREKANDKILIELDSVILFNGLPKKVDSIRKTTNRKVVPITEIRALNLDNTISYHDYSYLLGDALQNRIYNQNFQKQIENLAFEQHNKEAIFYFTKLNNPEYTERIKSSLLNYLINTDFEIEGPNNYYETLSELLKFKDASINNTIIKKLRKDKSWKNMEKGFELLFKENQIII